MSMRGLMKDTVSIVKPDGRHIDGIKAHVQPDKVFMEEHDLASFVFEEGDKVIRKLPNGSEEIYLVLDRGYYSAIGSFNAHYQAKVRKESAISTSSPPVTYNLHGAASKVNINSIDSSTSVINMAVDDGFQQLRTLLEQIICDASKKSELLDYVNQMESAKGSVDYSSRYTAFISAAADHMALIAPLIPFLTGLLK